MNACCSAGVMFRYIMKRMKKKREKKEKEKASMSDAEPDAETDAETPAEADTETPAFNRGISVSDLPLDQRLMSAKERLKIAFNKLDIDETGTLNREEMEAVMTPEDTEYLLVRADQSKDDQLTFEEYWEDYLRRFDPLYGMEKTIRESFEKIDKDDSGKISREEIDQWIHTINFTDCTAEELLDVVAGMEDTNRDHKFSFREFVISWRRYMMEKMNIR